MQCSENGGQRLNSFALVTYIPPPLGPFLDRLRRELTPGCLPHAHVTILPPRALRPDPEAAAEQVRNQARHFTPFQIRASEIEVFHLTSVVYLAVGQGWTELLDMHQRFNTGDFCSDEPFRYHPHITLGQDITPGQVPEIRELAQRRWAEYTGDRSFTVEEIAFVQNTTGNCWIDLAFAPLGVPQPVR